MATRISITTSRTDQSKAARALSDAFNELNIPHAYIGGFAWALLGSKRPTQISLSSLDAPRCLMIRLYDIDVLIEANYDDMQIIRSKLSDMSRQFAKTELKLFYVKELKDNLTGQDLIQANKNNVLIETLPAGLLGLPAVSEPKYQVENDATGVTVDILHPGVLFLTKVKRWYVNHDSTRPKTVDKTKSDRGDLEYLVYWLVENDMTIEFERYAGKSKEQLYDSVKKFRERSAEDGELMDHLKRAMKPGDWKAICAAASTEESVATMTHYGP